MLRDALTYPARRNERRPSLLFDRGERQRLGYVLRHFDRQRYAARLSSSSFAFRFSSSEMNIQQARSVPARRTL